MSDDADEHYVAAEPDGTSRPVRVHSRDLDIRTDLGPIGDGPPQLFAPPAMLPVPIEFITDDEWAPPQPVVVGAHSGIGWRYDCLAVSRRGSADAGTLEVAVSAGSEFSLAGANVVVDAQGRPPRYWWLPAARVWIERPVEDALPPQSLAQEPPAGPPVRMLTRATTADRVIGRSGWLARRRGWMPAVAVTDLWEADVGAGLTRFGCGGPPRRETYINVVSLRSWWRWGTVGDLADTDVTTVEAAALWLE